MARLVVLRGETLHREMEVGRQTIRIGRGEQNDLVLEDHGKAVSRNHAEIRYEGGRYVLADLESQNGIWVSGARVPFVFLDQNVVASVGPYRLKLDVDPPTDTDFALPRAVDGPDAPTEFKEPKRTEIKAAEPVARPAPKPAAAPPPPKAKAKPGTRMPAQTMWLFAGGAAVLVAVVAFAIFRFTHPPVREPTQAEKLVADARTLIEQGDCVRALRDAIDPALALEPNNAEALTLKSRAGACIPPPPPPPVAVPVAWTADEIAEHLRAAAEAIRRRECEPALTEHITKVLEQEPTNQQALDLKAKAEVCPQVQKPGPPPPPPVALAVRIPPDKGGLEPLSGELDKDYQIRIRSMKDRYDEAVAALGSGALGRAITALEGIARDATPRYLDVASKLTEARKAAAAQALTEAHDFDNKNDYDQAIQAFRRAGTLDRDARVDDDIKRVQDKKTQAGVKACDEAKNAYAFNRRQEALQLYQQVVRLLPAEHPCAVLAKDRIAGLK
jgi:tetratricopeptide (TPR) repeat protein